MPAATLKISILVLLAALAPGLLATPALASPVVAAPGAAQLLQARIAAARAQTDALSTRIDGPPTTHPAAEAAGIADGGRATLIGALRHAGHALERHADGLRQSLDPNDTAAQARLIHMRVELRAALWTLDDLAVEAPRPGTLRRLEATLAELARLAAALP